MDLSNTWLSCDCDLAWMTRVPVHGARCGGPSSVRGAYLRTLSLTSLGCGPGLQPEVVVVGVGHDTLYLVTYNKSPWFDLKYHSLFLKSNEGKFNSCTRIHVWGCVVLISIVLIISILCCTCRNKIKHIATCTVSATETTYKVISWNKLFVINDPIFLEFLWQLCLPRKDAGIFNSWVWCGKS